MVGSPADGEYPKPASGWATPAGSEKPPNPIGGKLATALVPVVGASRMVTSVGGAASKPVPVAPVAGVSTYGSPRTAISTPSTIPGAGAAPPAAASCAVTIADSGKVKVASKPDSIGGPPEVYTLPAEVEGSVRETISPAAVSATSTGGASVTISPPIINALPDPMEVVSGIGAVDEL
ncbi:calphotin-like [Hermetia illucens]|uniref:calphotin-like n=1 Tax=Hermetia illucens TaxID=343691 RepID=UPI0018CC6169|nr:calphotin-like [Hermetia illucens]